MRKGRWVAALLALCVGCGIGMAAEETAAEVPAAQEYGASLEPQRIVVTATRMDTPIQNVPDSVSVMSVGTPGETPSVARLNGNLIGDVEQRQYRNFTEALGNTPGVAYGNGGGTTQVYMRGLRSYYTKFMIDGMPMSDPGVLKNQVNFTDYAFDNMGQMEVMRGPQSTLYGSNAVGGVINMASKKGEGPLSGFLSTEGGSFGTVITRLGASAGTDKADFSLGGSFLHTDGVSMADKKYGNSEKDGSDRGNIALRLGANPTDCLRFDLFANAMKSKMDLDSAGAPLGDNPYYTMDRERYMIRPQATLTLFDGRWEQTAGVGYLQHKWKTKDEPYISNPWGADRSKWMGETWKFDYQSVVRLVEWNTILAGVDVVRESMETQSPYYGPGVQPAFKPDFTTTTGVFLEDQVNIGDVFSANIGVREEHHSAFGNHTTWKGGAAYTLPTQTRLLANIGTGFRAPSLYELYGESYGAKVGNPNLKPEKSFGWDAGIEQSLLCDRLNFGASYFQNEVKDRIDWSGGWPGSYVQVDGETRTWGIESFAAFRMTDNLVLSGQYTWTRARNEDRRGEKTPVQIRVPLNAFSLNLDWVFCEKGTFTAGVRHVGKRWDEAFDINGNSTITRMPSYTVARIGASWKFTKHIEVFGRVENLFNKKYQEVAGYGTPGIGFFGGATVSF